MPIGGIRVVELGDSGRLQFPSDSRKLNGETVLVATASEGFPWSDRFRTASFMNELPTTGRWRSPRRLNFSLEVLLKVVRIFGCPSLNELDRGLRLPCTFIV